MTLRFRSNPTSPVLCAISVETAAVGGRLIHVALMFDNSFGVYVTPRNANDLKHISTYGNFPSRRAAMKVARRVAAKTEPMPAFRLTERMAWVAKANGTMLRAVSDGRRITLTVSGRRHTVLLFDDVVALTRSVRRLARSAAHA